MLVAISDWMSDSESRTIIRMLTMAATKVSDAVSMKASISWQSILAEEMENGFD